MNETDNSQSQKILIETISCRSQWQEYAEFIFEISEKTFVTQLKRKANHGYDPCFIPPDHHHPGGR
jgi:hypothetical protein